MNDKFSKKEVGFESPAKGPHHCVACVHFRIPHSCEIVEGHIKPADWCRKWEKPKWRS